MTSYLASGRDITQISYLCTAPALSDKLNFPLFSRTVAITMLGHNYMGP